MQPVRDRLVQLENAIHRLLVRRSASAPRLAVGAVFFGFGLLKFFPGASPVEDRLPREGKPLAGRRALKAAHLGGARLKLSTGQEARP